MDAQIEILVELYLTRGGKVFVSPQYDVPYNETSRAGGACPDFVALDMENKEVVIVEVSSASNLGKLFKKIGERETRWFEPIRYRLLTDSVVDEGWGIRFLGFIRRSNLAKARERFPESDVCFCPLEDAAFSFAYWEKRTQGLPK